MQLNKNKEGRTICPKCGQHEVDIQFTDSEYVYKSVWHRLKSIFSFSRVNNTVGFYVVNMYICPRCRFKAVDKEFVAWVKGGKG